MKKIGTYLALLAIIMIAFASCGNEKNGETAGKEEQKTVASTPDYIGETFKYDKNAEVNNGEEITLVIWSEPDSEEFHNELVKRYTTIHPNVKFEVSVLPWGDLWTKLPIALASGTGPDLHKTHPGEISNFVNFSHAFPESVFPMADLKEDFPAISDMLFDGKLYSIPIGSMAGGGLYYNKDMWSEAGLTEADIPTTWDEFKAVGKKLVVKDGDNITQYGFSIDHTFENFIIALNYQKGYPTFKADNFTYNLDNPATYENIDMIKEFLKDFMIYIDGDSEDQFGQGLVAMAYQVSWMGGYLNSAYPDINWGFFKMPTFDGKTPPAYDYYGTEWSMGVSSKDDKKKVVAFDVMKYYAADTDLQSMKTVMLNYAPSKKSVAVALKDSMDEDTKVITSIIDRFVSPGIIPNWGSKQKGLRTAGSNIFIVGTDPVETIKAFQTGIMEEAERNKVEYNSIESHYKYASEFIYE